MREMRNIVETRIKSGSVRTQVGGLSLINAIAGSYSENLPVICLVGMLETGIFISVSHKREHVAADDLYAHACIGGPNSNDYGTNRVLHHTIGTPDFQQELR